jgi:hypothetical protein
MLKNSEGAPLAGSARLGKIFCAVMSNEAYDISSAATT